MDYQISRDMLRPCICLSAGMPGRARRLFTGLAAVAALSFAGAAQAASLDFACIFTQESSQSDCDIGEAQLTVDVSDAGSDQVNFRFNNAGPEASSITEVYFDDGELLGIATVTHSEDDPWIKESADPSDLPGGDGIDPPFEASVGFLAESDSPPPKNGVQPDEYLDVLFNLKTGKTFNDILSDLVSGDLRVGMHVIGFDGGGSESFVNDPNQPPAEIVPIPAALWLFGSGLLGLVGIARRRR